MLCASLFVALLAQPQVDLVWPAIDCPKQAEVRAFLDALLAAGEAPAAVIESATAAPDLIELSIHAEGRTVRRTVALVGACDRRAATVAAVIERALSSGGAMDEAPAASETATVAATASVAEPPNPPPPIAPEVTRGGWIEVGGHAALGTGLELVGGIDLEGGWWRFDPIGLGLRVAWRFPVVEPVGAGDVRLDEVRADLLVQWSAEPVAVEARLFGQLVWAKSRDLPVTGKKLLFNPGAGLGLRYRLPLGPLGLDVAARALIPFRSQRFLVGEEEIAKLPRFQVELGAGVFYAF